MRPLATALQHAALLKRRRRPRTRPIVPPARPPSAARAAYLRELLARQRVIEVLVRRDLLPLLPSILGQHHATRPEGSVRTDAAGGDVDEAIELLREQIRQQIPERDIELLAQESALRVAEHSRKELQRQLYAVARIDVFESSQGIAEHLDAFVSENVQLVHSLTYGQLDELKALILRGARQGLRAEVVARDVEERFGMTRRRATLIASDQVNKLNGELAQLRQQQVGIRYYTWSTSKDERVRKSHRRLDGTRHRWDKPPLVDGVHAHPGQPVRCRCQAIPDVDDVLREAGLLGAGGESLPPPAPR